jgi:hypothetical protein
MSSILTAQSKGKLKESGVQTGLNLLAAIVGGVTGQAIGRAGFVASIPVIFAGEYLDQPYVTSLGAGMASSLTAPSSVNGIDGLDGTAKIVNLKAAETRVKNYANNLKRAVFLGEADPTGGNYSYYLSDSDMSIGSIEKQIKQLEARKVRQAQQKQTNRRTTATNWKAFRRSIPNFKKFSSFTNEKQKELMSKISPFMQGLGEALAEYDEFLEGYDDINLMETFEKMNYNLEGITDAVIENPELMGIDDSIDEDTMEQIETLRGMLNGASLQGLNGNDEEFIENISLEIGALEGLLGVEDDEDDEFLNGDDEADEFGGSSSEDEFLQNSILFGIGEYDDDDVMEGIF